MIDDDVNLCVSPIYPQQNHPLLLESSLFSSTACHSFILRLHIQHRVVATIEWMNDGDTTIHSSFSSASHQTKSQEILPGVMVLLLRIPY